MPSLCRSFRTAVLLFATSPALVLALPAGSEAGRGPVVSAADRHDTSPPLRSIPAQLAPAKPDREVPNRKPLDLAERHKPFVKRPDPLVQAGRPGPAPAPLVNFAGGSDDDNAAIAGFRVVPPDTNGDVGPNHYVQFINSIISVYDKNGGLQAGFPKPGNAFWTGFGGICETNNDGDPTVVYDHLADRWVVSQFAIGADGHQCVAVSTTGDPGGSYYRYDFVVSPGAFNDYPKMGVWPDAYYLTANEFTSSFEGAVAVAFERSRMLAGQSARMVKFGPLPCTNTECFFSLQPSDLDGPAPAAGTPNTFVMSFDDETWGSGSGNDGYRLWDFAVNWTNPAASTFTALPQVDAPEFDSNLCNFSVVCVPEPKGGERLDTFSQATMYRAPFRQFSDHDSIIVTHSVDATGGNVAGVRWAELRRVGGAWSLQQTGTIATTDGVHRWMGSANIDKAGNVAIGYSASGTNLFPSIRYSVHGATDPPGQVGSEVTLQAGTGVQKPHSYNRWGDYSSMSVDPDGCTFWYTQEYYENSASFDFKTRIASIRMCTP
jgi:hypothetical protein